MLAGGSGLHAIVGRSRRNAEHRQRFVGSLWCAVRYTGTQAGCGDKDEQEYGSEPGQADADPLTGADR
jgi:hypothetical protein